MKIKICIPAIMIGICVLPQDAQQLSRVAKQESSSRFAEYSSTLPNDFGDPLVGFVNTMSSSYRQKSTAGMGLPTSILEADQARWLGSQTKQQPEIARAPRSDTLKADENEGARQQFDIRSFGAYYAATPFTATGSIRSGSRTLTIHVAGDYANGQGIVVNGAGIRPTLRTPGTPTITPNLLNGAVTWNYKVVAEDYSGGLTAASVAGTTTTGPASLGQFNFGISTATNTNGITTYTTTATDNLPAGAAILICGFGAACLATGSKTDSFNGAKTIQATPSSNTFTTFDGTQFNNPTFTITETPPGGQAQGYVMSCNTLRYSSGTYSGLGTLRYWIYRSQGAGAYSLVGVAPGIDPYFVDCGGTPPTPPSYVPTRTPPARPQAGYLSTTISSGGGSTTLTLAANAGTTATSQTVLHDNTPALMAAATAAIGQTGGTVYIPSTADNRSATTFWAFNSLANFGTIPATNGNNFTVFLAGNVSLTQPWVLRSNMKIEGTAKKNQAFQYLGGSFIGGSAIPAIYSQPVSSVTLRDLYINPANAQATSTYFDNDNFGNGSAGIIFENTSVSATGNFGRPFVGKGGFGWYFRQFTCVSRYITNNLPPPCVEFPDSSIATGAATSQVSGNVEFYNSFLINTGISFNATPNSSTDSPVGIRFHSTLMESGYTPFLRIANVNANVNDVTFTGSSIADSVVGLDTPFVDASGTNFQTMTVTGGQGAGGSPPLLISTSTNSSIIVNNPFSSNYGNVPWFASQSQAVDLGNQPLNVRGSKGRVSYAMSAPGALSGCVVSSGGGLPIGTVNYSLTAVDYDGYETGYGPVTTVTTTTGNQTVTCTLPMLPAGAKGLNVYHNFTAGGGAGGNKVFVSGCPAPMLIAGSLVDSVNSTCGANPTVTSAGSSFVSASGVGTYKLMLNGAPLTGISGTGTIVATSRGSFVPGHLPEFDANSNVVDSGISPTNVSDYFNRAVGNLGSEPNSPWTIQAGTLLVTAGAVGGNTTSQNYAIFTGVGFPNDDQTVSAIWVKSGTPTTQNNVLTLRGSPTALTNYNCGPNNTGTSLAIGKFVAGSFTSLGSQSATINNGDVISFNIIGSSMNCYLNGALIVGATDSSITSGFPGLGAFQVYNNNRASLQWKNWMASPGYVSLRRPQTWSQLQTFSSGLAIGAEAVSASPRGPFTTFFPGSLNSAWTGESWTLDKAIIVTRVQAQAKTAPSGCSTNAVLRVTDGTTPVNLTIAAAANDSGAMTQNYAAGATLTISVQTAASGCTTSPADANTVIQYKMR